jgi:hypothetical protein
MLQICTTPERHVSIRASLLVEVILPQRHGQEWIRTTEGVSQQIYSLPRLATSVPTRNSFPDWRSELGLRSP